MVSSYNDLIRSFENYVVHISILQEKIININNGDDEI
jgi:hypothetical protein